MFIGFGTVANIVTIVLGAGIGLVVGHRLPQRTRATVTDALGLVTILIGLLSAWRVTSPALQAQVGGSAPMLIVLGSLLIGGIAGSLLDIEQRLARLGDWLRRRLVGVRAKGGLPGDQHVPHEHAHGPNPDEHAHEPHEPHEHAHGPNPDEQASRARFIEGFVAASMLFCIGPLTVLGSLSDGLGLGADQLILKAVLDGFASIAFAASLGAGVLASAITVGIVQGSLTLLGFLVGDLMSPAQLDALTATGGLLLLGLGIRLLNLRQVPVGNLLPALIVAPLLTLLAAALA